MTEVLENTLSIEPLWVRTKKVWNSKLQYIRILLFSLAVLLQAVA